MDDTRWIRVAIISLLIAIIFVTVTFIAAITPKVFLRVQEEQGAFTVRFLMRI